MPCLSGNHWSSQASLSWKLSFKSWNFVARNCAIKIQEQWCCWGRPEWKQCPNKKAPQPTVPQPRVPNGPTSVPRISTWASSSWCAICCSLNYFVLKTRCPRNGLNQETFPKTVPPPFHLYLDPHQLDRGRTLVWMVSNLFQHVSKARVLISYTFSSHSSQWPPYEANSANHKFKVPTRNRRVLWPSLLFLEGWEESASVMFGWQSVETKHTSGQTYVLICFDQIIGALGYGALVVSNTKWKQIWEHLGASVWLYVLK